MQPCTSIDPQNKQIGERGRPVISSRPPWLGGSRSRHRFRTLTDVRKKSLIERQQRTGGHHATTRHRPPGSQRKPVLATKKNDEPGGPCAVAPPGQSLGRFVAGRSNRPIDAPTVSIDKGLLHGTNTDLPAHHARAAGAAWSRCSPRRRRSRWSAGRWSSGAPTSPSAVSHWAGSRCGPRWGYGVGCGIRVNYSGIASLCFP